MCAPPLGLILILLRLIVTRIIRQEKPEQIPCNEKCREFRHLLQLAGCGLWLSVVCRDGSGGAVQKL